MADDKDAKEDVAEEDFGPTCMYNSKGESQVCNTPEELKEAKAAGFKNDEPPKAKTEKAE